MTTKTLALTFDTGRIEQAAAIADYAVRSGTHPSAVLAIADRTQTLATHVAGDGVTGDSIFLLASLTKPIVATAIMQLVERRRLQLDEPIATYLPEFAQNGKTAVTAWHLLTHTSGLEGERWEHELSRRAAPAQEYVEAACRSTLHFAPGTRVEYCSLTFWVLGELITRLSGRHYTAYLHQHIFAPLGMRDTAFEPSATHRAAPVHDQHPAAIAYLSSLAAPGGGLWSTAADLISFGQTLLNGGRHEHGRLLGSATLEQMTRLHTAELQAGLVAYGLGWRKAASTAEHHMLASPRSFGHGGLTGTYLWIDPAYDLVFVFLSNRWGLEHTVPRRILDTMYGPPEASS